MPRYHHNEVKGNTLNSVKHSKKFIINQSDDKVGIISVQCLQIDESKTEVEITYHYIGISEKGIEFIKQFTSEEYSKFIDEWEKLLLMYFESKC